MKRPTGSQVRANVVAELNRQAATAAAAGLDAASEAVILAWRARGCSFGSKKQFIAGWRAGERGADSSADCRRAFSAGRAAHFDYLRALALAADEVEVRVGPARLVLWNYAPVLRRVAKRIKALPAGHFA